MSEKTLTEFIGRLQDSLGEAGHNYLSADTRYRELSAWTSLNALAVIVMVDEYYGVQLGTRDFQDFETVGELHDRVMAASTR
jgi:acyl carrier protein